MKRFFWFFYFTDVAGLILFWTGIILRSLARTEQGATGMAPIIAMGFFVAMIGTAGAIIVAIIGAIGIIINVGRKIMRTKKTAVYTEQEIFIAEDGKVFNNADDCIRYEAELHEKAFRNLPMISFSREEILGEDGSSLESYVIVLVRDRDDMNVINQYLEDQEDSDLLDENAIGSAVFICETDNTSWVNKNFSLEQMKTNIIANIDHLIQEKDRFVKENIG